MARKSKLKVGQGGTKNTRWQKTSYPGVRFREHPTRKHGIKKDRYYTIRYKIKGVLKEEGLGWSSEGWTAEKANIERAKIKNAYITGKGVTSLKEKRAIAAEQKEKAEKERDRQEKEKITFKQFFDEVYFPIAKTSKKLETCQKEKEFFKNWINPTIGELPCKSISPFHIEKIKKNLLDAGRAPRTVQYCLAIIRQVWNTAKNHNLVVDESPTKKVKIPKINNERIRFLSHDEAKALLLAIKKRSEQLYQISLISLHCGLRASEIFNLTWADVLLDNKILMLRDTKSGKTAVAYMTDEIKTMFQKMPKGEHNELVFKNRDGGKIKSVSNAFDRAVNSLKLNEGITDRRQKIVFHSLRHTYASWLVESGVDLYTVQKLMRHSNFKMTERYAHLSKNTLQNAVRQMESNIPKRKPADTTDAEVIPMNGTK